MTSVILKNEILSEEQLEQVAGGTCQETDEIINTIGEIKQVYKNWPKGYYTTTAKLGRGQVEDYLQSAFGIKATTHNGFLFFSDGDPNTYSQNGKSISHKQVLEIIKSCSSRPTYYNY